MTYLPSQPNATLIDAFKADPDIAEPLHQFAQALMRGPSPFTPGERELIAIRVSQANGCAYCRESHTAAARELGIADSLLEAVTRAAPEVPDKLAPVLAYVDRLNRAPESVSQADVDAILAAGWDESAVRHAAIVCGFFNLMNRWVAGLGIESDPRTVALAGRMLAGEGYAAVSKLLAS